MAPCGNGNWLPGGLWVRSAFYADRRKSGNESNLAVEETRLGTWCRCVAAPGPCGLVRRFFRESAMSTSDYASTVRNTHTKLKRNALNFWEVSAQAIALISPSMTAALIVPLMFGNRRHRRVALLCLRHHHAPVRGDESEPVRQALHLRRQHV